VKMFLKGQSVPAWLEIVKAVDEQGCEMKTSVTFTSTCVVWEHGESYRVTSLSGGGFLKAGAKDKSKPIKCLSIFGQHPPGKTGDVIFYGNIKYAAENGLDMDEVLK